MGGKARRKIQSMKEILKKILPESCEAEGGFYFKRGRKRTPDRAKEQKEAFGLDILVPRVLGAVSLTVKILDKDLKEFKSLTPNLICLEDSFDLYSIPAASLNLPVGLWFFDVRADSRLFEYKLRFKCEKLIFTKEDIADMPQLTVSSFEYGEPNAALGGVIYHVFVDRYKRGKEPYKVHRSGEYIEGEWGSIPEFPDYPGAPMRNNGFYGGTLSGVKDSLNELSGLGVNIIYLSPIFDSPSNHKYDTADYMKVDEAFGGEAALFDLIMAAEKRGIKIILDGVFNHTGADSIYFNKYGNFDSLGAYNSMASPYFSWYDFQEYPEKYACWWGIEILPRLRCDKKEVADFFVGEGGVIEKYRKMGVFGFRLDVCDELPSEMIEKIKEKLSFDGESYLIGEVWEDASNKIAYGKRRSYYLGRELDGVMNYPLREGIIDFLLNKRVGKLSYALKVVLRNCPKRIRDTTMNLLGSHDTERIITILSGVDENSLSPKEKSTYKLTLGQREIALKRLFLAFTILATLPGIPSIYYGDELGVEGFSDPFNRMPYQKTKDSDKILDFYRKIGIIRRGNSVFKEGEFSLLHLSDDTLCFSRREGELSLITVINNSDRTLVIRLSRKCELLISGEVAKEWELSPYSSEIIRSSGNNRLLLKRV